MSIEIDVLNGDASGRWPNRCSTRSGRAEVVEKLPWGHVKWAHADLRVLIEAPRAGLVCHVGIYFRHVTWNGRKVQVGGIGGVATREDCRRHGYASLALDAAVQTMRHHEAVQFALLFCEPHNFAFYQSRGWQPFDRRDLCRAAGGARSLRGDGALRVRFQPRAAAGRHRPMRPAVVTMRGRGGVARAGS